MRFEGKGGLAQMVLLILSSTLTNDDISFKLLESCLDLLSIFKLLHLDFSVTWLALFASLIILCNIRINVANS